MDPGDPTGHQPVVLMLCTGNAARSVMAGVMLEAQLEAGLEAGLEGGAASVRIVTAGTHVVENQPMSRRTRDALLTVGLDAPTHRSRQLTDADLHAADLVIAMAVEHVRYIRRRHPQASDRTATLLWLVDHLPAGPEPLAARVARLALADVDPADQGDVDDPAGGDEEIYTACATQLSGLVARLAPRLG